MTEHLYTPKDVQKVRELLLKEQGGLDLLTGLPIPPKQAVTDHCHKSQYVRGILHRQSNAVLGKIENLWTRYLSYWYTGTLQQFLRSCADYLDRTEDKRYVHPGFVKKLQTMFNSLNEAGKKDVLAKLGQPPGVNAAERKTLFKKVVMQRKFSFEEMKTLIEESKE